MSQHLPPRLIGARNDYCPDVFSIWCKGPDPCETRALELRGKSKMAPAWRTVYRRDNESDTELWARVMVVVKHFKDRYGFAQDVSVFFGYDLTSAQGAAQRAREDWLNRRTALWYTAHHDRSGERRVAALCAIADLYSSPQRPFA